MAGRGRGKLPLLPKGPGSSSAGSSIRLPDVEDDRSSSIGGGDTPAPGIHGIPSSAQPQATESVLSEISGSSFPASVAYGRRRLDEGEDQEPPPQEAVTVPVSESDRHINVLESNFTKVGFQALPPKGRGILMGRGGHQVLEAMQRQREEDDEASQKSFQLPPCSIVSGTTLQSEHEGTNVEPDVDVVSAIAMSSASSHTGPGTGTGPSAPSTSQILPPVVRPEGLAVINSNTGTSGQRVPVATNFIRLKFIDPNKKYSQFEYDVKFDPLLDDLRTRKTIIRQELTPTLGNTLTYDGSAKIYLPHELSDRVTIISAVNPNFTEQSIKVTITLIKCVPVSESVQLFNILINKIFRILELIEMGRNFYDYRASHSIPQHKLEVWPGYVSSVLEVEDGLTLLLDASHRVLRSNSALDVWNDLGRTFPNIEQRKKKFKEYCEGKIVHVKYNNMTYKVSEVDFNNSPQTTFSYRKEGQISFIDYYQRQHNKTITDKNQPLFIVNFEAYNKRIDKRIEEGKQAHPKKTPISLIPEFCFICGLTDEMKSNFKIMQDIAVYTRVNPAQRVASLRKFIRDVLDNEQAVQILANWGLYLDDNIMDFNARNISGPTITFHDGKEVTKCSADFSKEVMNLYKCKKQIPIENFLLFCTKFDLNNANQLMVTYKQVVRNFGIEWNQTGNSIIEVEGKTINHFLKKLKQYALPEKIQFIIVILPGPGIRDDLYAAIKKFCLCEISIPSQVILSKTLGNEKRFRSVIQKVGLQINCKLGGSLWGLQLPTKIMVVGMDVCHDTAGRKKSCGALIASLDSEYTKYYSTCFFASAKQENLLDGVMPAFCKALEAYRNENGEFPTRIVFFRDGVSDGQMSHVKDHEIPQIKNAIERLMPGKTPKFTFVVVQKRINERFYLKKGPNFENPHPGTVVDTVVTDRKMYDYFIVSQLVRQGTVTPTHYVVVEDNSNIKPDMLQKLTFSMTFMYFNWTGTIRVPSPCQYAHKLSTLAGTHLENSPRSLMNSKLYYL